MSRTNVDVSQDKRRYAYNPKQNPRCYHINVFGVDLCTPKGAATYMVNVTSCHAIFLGFLFYIVSSSHQRQVIGDLLRALHLVWHSTWTQFSILPSDGHRKHYIRILGLSFVIRAHNLCMICLSSPV